MVIILPCLGCCAE